MSSSWGNVISLLDTPADKFGKVMSVRDDLIADYLEALPICARPFPAARIHAGENPRDLKLDLAEALVELYHGEDEAKKARAGFIAQFSKGEEPDDMSEFALGSGEMAIANLLQVVKAVSTTSDGRRMVEQGGVKIDGALIGDPKAVIAYFPGMVIQAGKRHWARVTESNS